MKKSLLIVVCKYIIPHYVVLCNTKFVKIRKNFIFIYVHNY